MHILYYVDDVDMWFQSEFPVVFLYTDHCLWVIPQRLKTARNLLSIDFHKKNAGLLGIWDISIEASFWSLR